MLSNAAANALLKTLEEPPGHVVFVLATTDPQKVPPTIRSRTQHFELGLIGAETLETLLRDVRERAGLEIDDEAIAAAVRRGRGSARDALSALDQMVALGGAYEGRPTVAGVTGLLADEDASSLLVAVAGLHEAGWGPQQLAGELVDELRQAFLLTLAPNLSEATGADRARLEETGNSLGLAKVVRGMELLGRAQVEMRDAPDARVVLEIALVRLVRPELDETPEAIIERVARLERAVRSSATSDPPHPPDRPPAAPPSAAPPGVAAPPSVAAPPNTAAPRAARRGRRGRAPRRPPQARRPLRRHPTLGLPDPCPAGGQRRRRPSPTGTPLSRPGEITSCAACPRGPRRFAAPGGSSGWTRGLAYFALPNAAHRDRCEDVRPLLESRALRVLRPTGGDPARGRGPGRLPEHPPARSTRTLGGCRIRPGRPLCAGGGRIRGAGPLARRLSWCRRGRGVAVYTPPLRALIDELGRLPGIGPKSAQRLAFHLLRVPEEDALRLADAIVALKRHTTLCGRCFNVAEAGTAVLDLHRRRVGILTSSASWRTPATWWRSSAPGNSAGATTSCRAPSTRWRGSVPTSCASRSCWQRVEEEEVSEVILCTNPNLEGEATSMYLARLLSALGVRVTRLASGLPWGGPRVRRRAHPRAGPGGAAGARTLTSKPEASPAPLRRVSETFSRLTGC